MPPPRRVVLVPGRITNEESCEIEPIFAAAPVMGIAASALAGARKLAEAPELDAAQMAERTLRRRAVEAAIWGMPIVSVDAMRQAYFRDAGARYNDIVFWSKPADSKLQLTTPNASTYYVYFNYNLKDDPVVLDVPPAVGAGLFGSVLDAWQVLLGERTLPANVPAKQYWAVTVYALDTACFIRDAPRLGLDSYDTDMQRNEDGSVDVYFGPKPPIGKQANWISTAPDRPWFSLFRFYGPEQPLFDKTWTLPNITLVRPPG